MLGGRKLKQVVLPRFNDEHVNQQVKKQKNINKIFKSHSLNPKTINSFDKESIINKIFELHKLVNDKNTNNNDRYNYYELMYMNLHGLFEIIDNSEYDNIYNKIHNNEIDNNYDKYFTLIG